MATEHKRGPAPGIIAFPVIRCEWCAGDSDPDDDWCSRCGGEGYFPLLGHKYGLSLEVRRASNDTDKLIAAVFGDG